MKRLFICFLSLFLCSLIWAQNAEHQMLIPHTVYVGDTAQLNISFSSKIDFFKDTQNLNRGTHSKELSVQNFDRALDETKYTVKKILLTKNGAAGNNQTNYTLTILFTPWTTGILKIPPYRLEKDFLIIPGEITVDSIFNAPKVSRTFIENKGPLLIPGTTYRLLFKLSVYILLLILLITGLCKWRSLSLAYKNLMLILLYRKNRKNTENLLTGILKDNKPDKIKAEEIQTVMRQYLSVRFGQDFNHYGASEIWLGFDRIFQGLLSEAKEDAVENLSGLFTRTDYIRYSQNVSFNKGELSEVISQLLQIISILETPESKSQTEENK